MKPCLSFSFAPALLLWLPLLLFFPNNAHAELPPFVYEQWQREAAEALLIEVLSIQQNVTETSHLKSTALRVEARVLRVDRSASGLEAGAVIVIAYEHQELTPPLAGPSAVPMLAKGQQCRAYLKKAEQGGSYVPAAGGHSWE